MNKQQLDNIKRLTGYSYDDILKMSDMEFWRSITQSMVNGNITNQQYTYLNAQRQTEGLEDNVKSAIEVFGGRIIKE